jgi:hypothetical protein
MREIEVGLNNCKTILWVDDNILNPDWENKHIMEQAQMDTMKNIRFIIKTNTNLAIAFLKSCFG